VSVLNRLREHGAQSRAKIASALGLTRATVSSIVADLISASIVHETEYLAGEAGRPGLLMSLNANYGCILAVDLDLDRVAVVLANVGQEILWRESVPLSVGASSAEGLSAVSELIERALEVGKTRNLNCFGICVACAGMVDRQLGQLAYGPTSHWEHVSLKELWESRYGVPVYVENEAHAAAAWAHHYGPRPGARNLVYLSIGVGSAAGVFVDGVLLRGKQGFAGQVGHTFFADNGIRCSCGKNGCWVTEIGAMAVRRKLAEAGVVMPEESQPHGDWIESIYARVKKGDAAIEKVLESVGAQIGSGAARLVHTFNPSILIVGGRLGKLMSLFEPAIQEALLEQTLPIMAESLQIVVSDSGEDHLMGAFATVFDVLMRNPNLQDR
jgi:predicted NBD/HSP70 family sugar kinase